MKPMSSTNQGTLYRSQQALGKAIKRLEHGLPSSPRKQRFVVEKFAQSVGVPVCSSKKSTSAESEEKRELAHSFYRTDDISWQAPGKKDCIIICETTEQLTCMYVWIPRSGVDIVACHVVQAYLKHCCSLCQAVVETKVCSKFAV